MSEKFPYSEEETILGGHVLIGKVIRDVYPYRESGFRIVFKDGTSTTFEDAECYMAIMELRGQTGIFECRWTSYNGKVELTK